MEERQKIKDWIKQIIIPPAPLHNATHSSGTTQKTVYGGWFSGLESHANPLHCTVGVECYAEVNKINYQVMVNSLGYFVFIISLVENIKTELSYFICFPILTIFPTLQMNIVIT